MKKISLSVSVFIIISFLLHGNLHAQDKKAAEEIFRWFPSGEFATISHYDKLAAEKEETSFWFREYYIQTPDWLTMAREGHLPPSLRGHCETFTCVHLQRLVYKKGSGPKELAKKSYEKVKKLTEKEQPLVIMRDIGETMRVWRFSDLDTILKSALKRGEIDAIGESMFDRPIYRFRTEVTDSECFAFATITQEFLTATKLENLKLMIDAGYGQEMNFLDYEENAKLIDIIPMLGQYWTIAYGPLSARKQFEYMEKRGFPEEKLDEIRDLMENGLLFSFDTLILSDQIVKKSIYMYKSDDLDKYGGAGVPKPKNYPLIPEPRRTYVMLNDKRKKCEADGNLEMVTVVYDEELLEAQKEVKSHLEGLWAKKRDSTKDN